MPALIKFISCVHALAHSVYPINMYNFMGVKIINNISIFVVWIGRKLHCHLFAIVFRTKLRLWLITKEVIIIFTYKIAVFTDVSYHS